MSRMPFALCLGTPSRCVGCGRSGSRINRVLLRQGAWPLKLLSGFKQQTLISHPCDHVTVTNPPEASEQPLSRTQRDIRGRQVSLGLKLPPMGDTHHFHSHFLGQSNGCFCFQEVGKCYPLWEDRKTRQFEGVALGQRCEAAGSALPFT